MSPAHLNQVTIIGEIVGDPEIRTTQSGDLVAIIKVQTALTKPDTDGGSHQNRSDTHRVISFERDQVDLVHKSLRSGDVIKATGRLQYRKYQPARGPERWMAEIVIPANGYLSAYSEAAQAAG